MQKFVDRDEERCRLVEAAVAPPQLVVLRGRRRVGKSFLIERSLEGHRHVSFQADEQPERGHLELLANEAGALLPGHPPLVFANWDTALTFFAAQATSPLVLVLDEFQWMVAAQPALPSILQRHWDLWQHASTPLSVVLSGSALTMLEGLLDHGSPLFGRANYRPLLQPLDYRASAEFARTGSTPDALLQRFAVLGGTPQYQVWAGRGSIGSVIRDRILAKGESLYEEPLHLLRGEQQIRDPGTYFAVLRAIAGGATQYNEILQQSKVEKNLELLLGRLEELGYIERRRPVELQAKQQRSSYRIADPFFRFWFRYVFPNRSRLERGRGDELLVEIERDLDTFLGLAFEDCCRTWIGTHAPNGRFPASSTLGSWWSRDGQVEIDIAGMSKGHYDVLGSCKWATSVRSRALGDLLAARAHLGGTATNASLVLFARGFSDEIVQRATHERVELVSAADLFS